MRNLLALAAAAALTFVGVGWYLGWYRVETTAAPQGHNAVQIDIDRHKIGDDLHKGSEKLQEALEKGQNPADPKKSPAPLTNDQSQAGPDLNPNSN